jgi:glycosyltransferase involved in cell wall biosynthesis
VVTDHGVFAREQRLRASHERSTPFARHFSIAFSELLHRTAYAFADTVVGTSKFNRRWQIQLGADPERVRTIHNGVDADHFAPSRPQSRWRRRRPTVVAACAVSPLKDVETLIRAAEVSRREIPAVRYLIRGSLESDRRYLDRCRVLVRQLGLGGSVRFLGEHPGGPGVYADADVAALSSLTESLPFSVLEPMSCGLPVVATDAGGVSEVLEDCGSIVPPRDPEAFGEAVVRILRNDALRADLGRKARARIADRFSSTQTSQSYAGLYKSLLASPGRTP